jgi:hypothetical protein
MVGDFNLVMQTPMFEKRDYAYATRIEILAARHGFDAPNLKIVKNGSNGGLKWR